MTEDVATFILKKNTILYRSAIKICELRKNLIKYKEKCEDTGKVGLYFSDSPMIPFGMSFEYLEKYGMPKNIYPGASFVSSKTKKTVFKKHLIGKFKVLEDIILYYGKYSFRCKKLGGKGIEDYDQEPTYNYNHVDDVSIIIPDYRDSLYQYLFRNREKEYFIGQDSDLEKIKFVEAYDFDIDKFKHSVETQFLRIQDYVENEYLETCTKIICEEDGEDGQRKSRRKSRKKSFKKSRRKSKKKHK